MQEERIVLALPTELREAVARLDNRTFQIHVLPGGKIEFVPVTLITPDVLRCPVIVGGERCGRKAGHEGKHYWSGGD